MPRIKYIVDLTDEERQHLHQLIRQGSAKARTLTRARILLKADEGFNDAHIAQALDVGRATVERTRKRFVEENLDALHERPRPGAQRKLTVKQEAHLLAVSCTPAPEGRARWTLRLLADKVVELGFADTIARETVRGVLKKAR